MLKELDQEEMNLLCIVSGGKLNIFISVYGEGDVDSIKG